MNNVMMETQEARDGCDGGCLVEDGWECVGQPVFVLNLRLAGNYYE